ncbi:MAG: hypothetical protein ACJ8AK_02875 [Gemmatimonadaceae bacterium]
MTRARKSAAPKKWSAEVGVFPNKVVVEENPHRQGGIYLRWWRTGVENWGGESLKNNKLGKPLRNADGSVNPDVAQWAVEQAMRKSQQLSGTLPVSGPQAKRVTIGEVETLITDKETGKYPNKFPFRDELVRSLRFAVSVWGADTPVDSIDDSMWTKLIRARVSDLVRRGHKTSRSADTTVSRLITAINWLRKKKLIPLHAAQIDTERTASGTVKWKDDLRAFRRGLTGAKRDPEPYQPRFTLEQMRKIVKAAPFVDPRIAILIYVTAELRLGQTSRAMRSDLKLDKAEFGELHVHGAGHKSGEIVELTKGMRIVVDAYLTGFLGPLEEQYLTAGKDYPLFPAGRIFGRKHGVDHRLGKKMRPDEHVSRQWVIKTFHAVRAKAGIAYVKGMGAYGLRRLPVDLALEEELGEQGLKALGGWSSTTVPKGVYAERENRIGRRAARDFKAKLRGENERPEVDTGPESPAEAFARVDGANEVIAEDLAARSELSPVFEERSPAADSAITALIGGKKPSQTGGSNAA